MSARGCPGLRPPPGVWCHRERAGRRPRPPRRRDAGWRLRRRPGSGRTAVRGGRRVVRGRASRAAR